MNENLSSSLSHYFAKMAGAGPALNTADHVAHGADCVRPSDTAACIEALPDILRKVASDAVTGTLRRQVEYLARFVQETPAEGFKRPQREAVFVLFYLLNGRDLIPDNIPEIGLLDDTHLVEAAYTRNLDQLRTHWTARGRPWLADS